MKVKFIRKAKGDTLNVFAVTGNATELKAFEKHQGSNYRTDEETKAPVFITMFGDTAALNPDKEYPLLLSKQGKFYVDDSSDRVIIKIAKANNVLPEMLASMLRAGSKPAQTPVAEPVPVESLEPDDLPQ